LVNKAWVGRLAEAEDAYRAAFGLVPDDPVAHGNLGQFLMDQARYREAEAECSKAIQLQPEHGSFDVQPALREEQVAQAKALGLRRAEPKGPVALLDDRFQPSLVFLKLSRVQLMELAVDHLAQAEDQDQGKS
jgi:tetratricopeptide (TPR) repeat protein